MALGAEPLGGADAVAELDELATRLLDDGILIPRVHYPDSLEGGYLRVALSASHSERELERLITALDRHLT